MASVRQILANRKNAKQSTGPQTVAGKRRSSQNALKHGLARPSEKPDAKIQDLADLIACALGAPNTIVGALALARARLRLTEVRRIRNEMLAALLEAPLGLNIKAIDGLDRYDRAAFTEHRRALRLLGAQPG